MAKKTDHDREPETERTEEQVDLAARTILHSTSPLDTAQVDEQRLALAGKLDKPAAAKRIDESVPGGRFFNPYGEPINCNGERLPD